MDGLEGAKRDVEAVGGKALILPADEFKRTTDVTYLGQVYGAMAALRHMLPRDHGAHGIFSRRSQTTCPALWLVMNEHKLALAGTGMLAAAAGLALLKKAR